MPRQGNNALNARVLIDTMAGTVTRQIPSVFSQPTSDPVSLNLHSTIFTMQSCIYMHDAGNNVNPDSRIQLKKLFRPEALRE